MGIGQGRVNEDVRRRGQIFHVRPKSRQPDSVSELLPRDILSDPLHIVGLPVQLPGQAQDGLGDSIPQRGEGLHGVNLPLALVQVSHRQQKKLMGKDPQRFTDLFSGPGSGFPSEGVWNAVVHDL